MNEDLSPNARDDPDERPETPETTKRGIQSGPPIYSLSLIVCLVLVWLCQIAVDGPDAFLFGGERSALLAGFLKPAFAEGQYWRLLTAGSLHSGIIHLFFNCYALYVLGRLIELLSNRAHLAIIFVLSVIGGNLMSFWLSSVLISVGASGGIVGFLGYLAVYGYKRRKVLTSSFLRGMLFNIGFLGLYGLALSNVIDNFGHLGGLLTGAAYGIFQIPGEIYEDPRIVNKSTYILGVGALGVFVATCLLSILILLRVIPVRLPDVLFGP
jgi:rhomboid protease GluP